MSGGGGASGGGGEVGGVQMEEAVCCFSGGSPPFSRETYHRNPLYYIITLPNRRPTLFVHDCSMPLPIFSWGR